MVECEKCGNKNLDVLNHNLEKIKEPIFIEYICKCGFSNVKKNTTSKEYDLSGSIGKRNYDVTLATRSGLYLGKGTIEDEIAKVDKELRKFSYN